MNPADHEKLSSPKRVYIFWRGMVWYALELPEATVADNAECNPGTTKVTEYLSGKTVWEPPIEISCP